MSRAAYLIFISLVLPASLALAGQGPAGTGACSHVIGPIDRGGKPIGFSCEDVGGSALLVWNAASLSSNVTVTGRVTTLNFFPGDFSIDGSFKSAGDVGFIGAGLTINGRISGANVLIFGAASSPAEIKSTLLTPGGRLTSNTLAPVIINNTGKVTATGNITIGGSYIQQGGQLTATNGTVALRAGTKLDTGLTDVVWKEGAHTSSRNKHSIRNDGTITASSIEIEAHRIGDTGTPMTNAGKLIATNTVTFISGLGGNGGGSGTYGVLNTETGLIKAADVTIRPFYAPPPTGTGEERTFHLKDLSERTELQALLGGQIFGPQQDLGTSVGTSSAVIDSTTTTSIVIPQFAASLSQMNATQQPKVNNLAVSNTSDRLRGGGKPAAPTSNKPRPKAKPVLVRGAFFGAKISATITAR